MIEFTIGSDLFPLLAGLIAAVTCGVLGNYLVLRRLSLMGDAISHSVLPGLVIAFILAGTRSAPVMFAGAALAGVATVVLVELVKRLGRVEPGAAMGVVFSVLFALGVLLIEQVARQIDLDADCVLHGQLEGLVWFGAPDSWREVLSMNTIHAMPTQIRTQGMMLIAAVLFVVVFFKELRIAAFDPALATSLGFKASGMHFALMVVVAAATVASFEAVGSILVIAMLICPAATARLLTDRLRTQVILSILIAALTAVVGYFAATALPALWGKDDVSASGSITLVAGGLFTFAMVFAPRYGVFARSLNHRRLTARVMLDDLLGLMFRNAEEQGSDASLEPADAACLGPRYRRVIAAGRRAGLVEPDGSRIRMTPQGRQRASELIRRHRLWEHYLVERAGLSSDHVHDVAEQLEHLEGSPPTGPTQDPHGKRIPDVDESGSR